MAFEALNLGILLSCQKPNFCSVYRDSSMVKELMHCFYLMPLSDRTFRSQRLVKDSLLLHEKAVEVPWWLKATHWVFHAGLLESGLTEITGDGHVHSAGTRQIRRLRKRVRCLVNATALKVIKIYSLPFSRKVCDGSGSLGTVTDQSENQSFLKNNYRSCRY